MNHRDDIEAVYPLSPAQQGMLFHAQLAPGTSNYMVQSACLIRGDLKVESFERAWQRVVERHAALRTAFLWEGLKDPMQVVGRRVTVRLEQEDWRQLTPAEQAKRLEAFLAEDLAGRIQVFKSAVDEAQTVASGRRCLGIRLDAPSSDPRWDGRFRCFFENSSSTTRRSAGAAIFNSNSLAHTRTTLRGFNDRSSRMPRHIGKRHSKVSQRLHRLLRTQMPTAPVRAMN
jgi:hypothetical protein